MRLNAITKALIDLQALKYRTALKVIRDICKDNSNPIDKIRKIVGVIERTKETKDEEDNNGDSFDSYDNRNC